MNRNFPNCWSRGPFHRRQYRDGEVFYSLGTSPDRPWWGATSAMACKVPNGWQFTMRIFGRRAFFDQLGLGE